MPESRTSESAAVGLLEDLAKLQKQNFQVNGTYLDSSEILAHATYTAYENKTLFLERYSLEVEAEENTYSIVCEPKEITPPVVVVDDDNDDDDEDEEEEEVEEIEPVRTFGVAEDLIIRVYRGGMGVKKEDVRTWTELVKLW